MRRAIAQKGATRGRRERRRGAALCEARARFRSLFRRPFVPPRAPAGRGALPRSHARGVPPRARSLASVARGAWRASSALSLFLAPRAADGQPIFKKQARQQVDPRWLPPHLLGRLGQRARVVREVAGEQQHTALRRGEEGDGGGAELDGARARLPQREQILRAARASAGRPRGRAPRRDGQTDATGRPRDGNAGVRASERARAREKGGDSSRGALGRRAWRKGHARSRRGFPPRPARRHTRARARTRLPSSRSRCSASSVR